MRQALSKILAIFFAFALSTGAALAGENGIYLRNGTASFVAPTANQTVTFDTAAKQWKVWSGSSWQTLATGPSNLAATVSPTVSNDSSQGYSAGSVWVDTAHQTTFLCVNASVGAAVWLAVAPNPALFTTADNFSDYLVSGLVGSVPGSSLTMTTPTGVIYTLGQRLTPAATTYTYPINSDVYDYFQTNSTFNHIAVANNAAAPTGQPGQLIQKVVTNGSVITAVTNVAQTSPLFSVANATTGTHALNRTTGDARYAPINPTYTSQSQNLVYGSPAGGSGLPSFRSLVNLDLPLVGIANGGLNSTATPTANCLLAGNGTQYLPILPPTTGYLQWTGSAFAWSTLAASALTLNGLPFLTPTTGALTANVAAGDTIYGSATNVTSRLSIGADSQAMSVSQTLLPAWQDVIAPGLNEFRLSLSSSDPLPITDQAGASTIYSLPYGGNSIALNNGSRFVRRTASSASIAVPATQYFREYFVYEYDNAGTPTLELDAWDNGGQLSYGINAATAANPCVITTASTHTIAVGDQVGIRAGTGTGTGWTNAAMGLDQKEFYVSAVTGTTITLEGCNTSGLTFTTFTGATVYKIPATPTTAPVRQSGVWYKTGALTRRLVGGFKTNGSGTVDDTKLARCLSNVDNQLDTLSEVLDATGSYTTLSTSNFYPRTNSLANRLTIFNALNQAANFTFQDYATTTASSVAGIALEIDRAATALPRTDYASSLNPGAINNASLVVPIDLRLAAGNHFIQMMNYGGGNPHSGSFCALHGSTRR